uniref:Putative secreted protein n=1 Tax=Ixodes ricinus TaxID=34613 RepID=A0A6B0UIW8_IXORI
MPSKAPPLTTVSSLCSVCSCGIMAMSWAMSSASIRSTVSSRRGLSRWNLVKSWAASFSCISFRSGKSPGEIWCSRWISAYRAPRPLMRSFFLLSLPNMDGISLRSELMM